MIDVSAAQGTGIDWSAVRASGVELVAIEAGIGNDVPNVLLAEQVAGCVDAGLLWVPYDFGYALPVDGIHANRDPVAQVDLFLRECPSSPGGIVVLDLEFPRYQDLARWREAAPGVRAWARGACAELVRRSCRPIIYVAQGYAEAIDFAEVPELGAFPLWLAEWGPTSLPEAPAPWATVAAWQYSNAGSVDGIDSPVDLSWVNLDALGLTT